MKRTTGNKQQKYNPSKKYEPGKIESYWQSIWEESGIYQPDLANAKKPFYNLMMFPYPSAEGLHVGSVYAFGGADVYGRFKRMQGYDVFEPIGLDGFGIHSENHAIKTNSHPMEHARRTEKNFYKQLHSFGNSFAWKNKLETYDPHYYKWTQWLFTELFKSGLAYRKESSVNFCPHCKTVLADEQVITRLKVESGKSKVTKGEVLEVKGCERCDTPVEKRELEQWFFAITKYADRLLENIEKLDWTEKVKIAQRNWIGKSQGAKIRFKIKDVRFKNTEIEVFTTRPDTLYGVTFVVIAPEHPLVKRIRNRESGISEQIMQSVNKYIEVSQKRSESERLAEGNEKSGVFSGLYATHPLTGGKLPVWIADYVLGNYGTGAVMGVPAHDQRDLEFAKKFDLLIKFVIDPITGTEQKNPKTKQKIVALVEDAEDNILTVNWGYKRLLVGGTVEPGEDPVKTAIREIAEETGYKDVELIAVGEERVHHRYFAQSKNQPFHADTTTLYFRLKSKKRDSQKLEDNEKDKFTIEWVTKDQARQEVLDPLHRYVFDKFIEGKAYHDEGILVNSGEWTGWQIPRDFDKTISWLEDKQIGERQTTYHLRDWLISRQRYWGPPIPMIYCESCAKRGESWFTTDEAKRYMESGIRNQESGQKQDHNSLFLIHNSTQMVGWYPVPEKDLPVKLPYLEDYKPLGTGKSPLASDPDFVSVTCPGCGGNARRETDVSDNFLDSAWYFFRYLSVDRDDVVFDIEAAKKWLPVDQYIGGAEHAVLHLLYSRFITMALHHLGYISFDEPFKRFFAHGLIIKDGAKMSKSKGNVINPDDYIRKFGADTLRCYLMFLGPFDQGGDFRDSGIEGMHRFLKRVWKLFADVHSSQFTVHSSNEKQRMMHQTIKGVTEDLEHFRYNRAIAKLMSWYNFLAKQERVSEEEARVYLQLLAPFAPYMTEELWNSSKSGMRNEESGSKGDNNWSIHTSDWPVYKAKFLTADEVTIAVQVNGKLRSTLLISKEASGNNVFVESEAKKDEKASKFISAGEVKKVVYVPGKVINFVVG